MDLIPESALDSLLFRNMDMFVGVVGICEESVVCCLPHGNERARSAKVSRLHNGALFAFAFGPPPHSLKMSVNCAKDDLLLL